MRVGEGAATGVAEVAKSAAIASLRKKVEISEIKSGFFSVTLTGLNSSDMEYLSDVIKEKVKKGSSVESIKLDNCSISLEQLSNTRRLKELKSIEFVDAYSIEGWENLTEFKQLKSLAIDGAGVDHLDLEGLQLETLSLKSCLISDTGFVAKQAPTLKSLTMHSCSEITSLEFLKGLSLKTLELKGVAGGNPEEFNAIAANTELTSLILHGYHFLDSLEFIRSLTKLATLKVENCVRLENIAAVEALKSTLKVLSFGHCSALVSKQEWIERLGVPDTTLPTAQFGLVRSTAAAAGSVSYLNEPSGRTRRSSQADFQERRPSQNQVGSSSTPHLPGSSQSQSGKDGGSVIWA